MDFVIDDIEELEFDEMIQIEGGKFIEKSFGEDVGYAIGWLLSALGKGASAIHG